MFIRKLLAHPLTRGIDIDDPLCTEIRASIIKQKGFLRRIYENWYEEIAEWLPYNKKGKVLEIGSGGGFLSEVVPNVITSEVYYSKRVDIILKGGNLPFMDNSLSGIVMTCVLHHIAEPRTFLREASRCVQPGGYMIMIEPWVTVWSRFVYTKLHEEPFETKTQDWEFASEGPLSGANGALPWIIFERDRDRFEHEFPQWNIESIKLHSPFCYILSGGVSLRNIFPEFLYPALKRAENLFFPFMKSLAMFATVALVRKELGK
ncbi:MAG: class I SAM-dependent methyltransferase [Clostridiales bacterium]|nr:class I SAM-dependent methyltransferase [Clostridiales bacterium]